MIPSPNCTELPCFPECVEWIIHNQHTDGSWGLCYRNPSLIKDALSSTLACVLALKQWNVGEDQIRSGIQFIAANFSSSMDEQLNSPIGFDLIFPNMIEKAMDVGLNLQVSKTDIYVVLHKRDLELKRWSGNNSEGRKVYLAYVAEGFGYLKDWKEIMKYQMKNGSLFNSPSATAAALRHISDDKAFNYLRSILDKFGASVPTVYPRGIYTHLCVIDNLQGLGIAEYFSHEIKSILDKVYRRWLRKDEEITSDLATCAMAFRLLRLSSYDVSSGDLAQFDKAEHFSNSVQGHTGDINAVLQLFKASQVQIFANEHVLEKLNYWSRQFLEEELSLNATHGRQVIHKEIEDALKFPFYANMDRLEHKRNIEHYDVGNLQTLKTTYTFSNVSGKDLLGLAMETFNNSQSMYRKELKYLANWVKENRLDQLKYARQKTTYCYLTPAATLFSSQFSDARMCMAKGAIVATYIDDFFDIGGSREEHLNLIALVEKWDINQESEYCSEQVQILFSALYSMTVELGTKASTLQKRSVTEHLIDIWLDCLRSMMKEGEWERNKTIPTMNEYMTNGSISIGLGPVVESTLYFLGPELSKYLPREEEYQNLNKLMGTCVRLLNDIQGFEREGKQGKLLNSVSLKILHSGDSISEEEAKKELRDVIDSSRTELLKLVLATEATVVPKACKDIFWKICGLCHLYYMNSDGFTSQTDMVGYVNAVIKEPLQVIHSYSENSFDMSCQEKA